MNISELLMLESINFVFTKIYYPTENYRITLYCIVMFGINI